MSFKASVELFFTIIGIFTVSGVIAICSIFFIDYIKNKCLCHHEFELYMCTEFDSHRQYLLKCRKCGEEKTIRIYHKEGSDLK